MRSIKNLIAIFGLMLAVVVGASAQTSLPSLSGGPVDVQAPVHDVHRHRADRQVHEEDPPPVEVVDEEPAEQRTEQRRQRERAERRKPDATASKASSLPPAAAAALARARARAAGRSGS